MNPMIVVLLVSLALFAVLALLAAVDAVYGPEPVTGPERIVGEIEAQIRSERLQDRFDAWLIRE